MDTRIDRRQTLRLLAAGTLAAVPALRLAGEAAAGITWCRTDPWVRIDGTHLNVYAMRDADAPNLSTGPIKLDFQIPAGANANVIQQDAGFGYGYAITFTETSTLKGNSYQVRMYVPASDSSMAVRLECDPVDPTAKSTYKVGNANQWLSVITKI